MKAYVVSQNTGTNWTFPASAAVHTLLILILLVFSHAETPLPPLSETTPVEFWTAEQWDELQAQGAADVSNDAPAPPLIVVPPPSPAVEQPPTPTPEAVPNNSEKNPGMTHAQSLLAANVLSHPRSRNMRQALPKFEEETRMEQICGIEAMAQIAAAGKFQPDRVVAYAMSDVTRLADTLTANGAAFRSEIQWYRLKFVCQVSADRQQVEDFWFLVGDAIPKRRWERYNLPAFF